jgi:hypothetical protein
MSNSDESDEQAEHDLDWAVNYTDCSPEAIKAMAWMIENANMLDSRERLVAGVGMILSTMSRKDISISMGFGEVIREGKRV